MGFCHRTGVTPKLKLMLHGIFSGLPPQCGHAERAIQSDEISK